MNDVITQPTHAIAQQTHAVTHNPFQRMQASHINAGSVAIESERAIAEAQAKMVIAKRFPRDEATAFSKAMAACQRPQLASAAFYQYRRGGENVSGPTIRLAEELARCWGNIEYGIRELSRKDGVSEMQAFAIDLEANNHSVQNFTVRHIRDLSGGNSKDLVSERDIYEMTANMGGRRLRARILSILPPDLKEAAIEQCRMTIAGGGGIPLADRIKKMVVAFAKLGVSDELIVQYLGHKIDTTTPDEFADLTGIYTSIKDGVTKVGDWFGDNAGNMAIEDQKSGINELVKKQAQATKPAVEKKADKKPNAKAAAQPEEPEHESKTVKENSNTAQEESEPAPITNTDQPTEDDGLVF